MVLAEPLYPRNVAQSRWLSSFRTAILERDVQMDGVCERTSAQGAAA